MAPIAGHLSASPAQKHATESTDLELLLEAATVAAARMDASFALSPLPTMEDQNFGLISSPSFASASFMFIGIITAQTLETSDGAPAGYGAQMDQVRRAGGLWV